MTASSAAVSARAAGLLELLSGAGRSFFPIAEAGVTVGRHPSNAVRVVDERASRFHCIVRPTPKGFRVADLGSRNGTRVNGRSVDSALLKPGDVIWVGEARLRFLRSGREVEWLPDA